MSPVTAITIEECIKQVADNGLWFKLWCSSDDDDDLDNLDIADYGRWCKLGAHTKEHGTNGVVKITAPARTLCTKLQVTNIDVLHETIKRFPNVSVEGKNSGVSSETNAPVSLIVTWHNWAKYQGDYSTDRVRRWREKNRQNETSKKRREEMRRDEKRGEHNSDTSFPAEAIEAAQLLSDKIFENFPQRTAPTEAQLMNWARDAEKINRIDQHSWPEISDLIKWSQEHSFWKANILSMSKFREQWNKLVAQRQRDSNNSKPNEPKGFAGIREWEKMQAKDKK